MTPTQFSNRFRESPSQTAGPFVHIGTNPHFIGNTGQYKNDLGASMVNDKTAGHRINISGSIIDGSGTPLRDAMVEIWQADYSGLYRAQNEHRGQADENFTGWGRCACDFNSGAFSFETVKPGSVPFPDGSPQAPHITFWIVARGINIGLHTRMYFPDEEAANAIDPVLTRIEHKVRIPTLIAKLDENTNNDSYRFDIHLQGENETIFFDV